MAQVLIIADGGHTKLASFPLDEGVYQVEDDTGEEHELSWRLIGLATMAVVSAAGWLGILTLARHFLH